MKKWTTTTFFLGACGAATALALAGCEDESSGGGGAFLADGGGFSLPDTAGAFAISGTVTGLVGKGLVLEERTTGQTLPVAEGAFAFPTRLASGDAYDVRIQTAPSDPFQVCVVDAGSGVVGGGDVASVAVRCLPPLPSGALDPSFGAGGKVSLSGHLPSKALVVQPDGKLLSLENLEVWRYLPDGAPDTTFGPSATGAVPLRVGAMTVDVFQNVALQKDGKILLVGYSRATGAARSDFAVIRLNANGSLDTTFGGDGSVTTDFAGETDRANAVIVQNDGSIVVAGSAQMPIAGGFFGNDYALVRYLPNGDLDPAFGGVGKVTTTIAGATDLGSSVALQVDGKILVAGRVADRGADDPDVGVVRYLSNGTLDRDFGSGGIARIDYGSGAWDEATDVVVQPDGRIVIGGHVAVAGDDRFAVARLEANGGRDLAFGTGGATITAITTKDDFARAVALQPDGKIVLAGEFANLGVGAAPNFGVVRYTANGAIDPTFGVAGRLEIDFFAGRAGANDVVVDAAGRIVLGGSVTTNGRTQLGLVRIMP